MTLSVEIEDVDRDDFGVDDQVEEFSQEFPKEPRSPEPWSSKFIYLDRGLFQYYILFNFHYKLFVKVV